jgi:hypothetical protein
VLGDSKVKIYRFTKLLQNLFISMIAVKGISYSQDLWPIDGDKQPAVITVFQQRVRENVYGLHEGIDIPDGGQNNRVRLPTRMKLNAKTGKDPNCILQFTTGSGNSTMYHIFMHLCKLEKLDVGDVYEAGWECSPKMAPP